MTVLAEADITGPEARGAATLVADGDSAVVSVRELWVAPGAPDVRLYLSPHEDGRIDTGAVDLGSLADGVRSVERAVPPGVDATAMGSVVVYCGVYSVHFGHGRLRPAAG